MSYTTVAMINPPPGDAVSSEQLQPLGALIDACNEGVAFCINTRLYEAVSHFNEAVAIQREPVLRGLIALNFERAAIDENFATVGSALPQLPVGQFLGYPVFIRPLQKEALVMVRRES